VGTQLPFDRMVKKVDEWAAARERDDVFAQIGPTKWTPRHIEGVPFIEPAVFKEKIQSATAIVSHAGMGTIITALELGKPILVMPRRADLREHRTDHQLATVEKFRDRGGVLVAQDETELFKRLDELEALESPDSIQPQASEELLSAIRRFVNE
jgi:UDP-N-acetylglucosamine transferase subunit ALG13